MTDATLAQWMDTGHVPLDVMAGCDTCGTCIEHDGCEDDEMPLRAGDCADCGACSECIRDCQWYRMADDARVAASTGATP